MNQIIAQNPNQPRLHEILGQVYLRQKNIGAAEEEYKKAAAIDPQNRNQRIVLAQFYANSGQQAKSIETLEGILRDDPSNSAVRLQLAEIFLMRKELDRSMQAADEVLKTNSKDANGLLMKGRILLAQNKVKDAIGMLQSAVGADSSSQAARYFLGLAFLQSGDRQRADKEWSDAVNLGAHGQVYFLWRG
jgi:predicted Zn-dependent protease